MDHSTELVQTAVPQPNKKKNTLNKHLSIQILDVY